MCEVPASAASQVRVDAARTHSSPVEFLMNLSSAATREFESLAVRLRYPGMTALISEGQKPSSVLLLLEGRVKISVNSSDGRRLILGIAQPGEILGLTSAVSGFPYEITAEAQFPCITSCLERQRFLDFLLRYPVAFQNATRQLGLDQTRTTQRLRTLGLTLTAHAKLARLIMDWCPQKEHNARGAKIRCALTHEEIGEHIGVSRETVTRSMKDFKKLGLVEQRGSVIVVPNCDALETYACAS